MMPLEDLEMADAMAEAEAAEGDSNSQPNSQTGRNGSTVSTGAAMADAVARVQSCFKIQPFLECACRLSRAKSESRQPHLNANSP